MRTGDGTGAGGGEVDPADLWVLDPSTGEYRMRQPGEEQPARPSSRREPAAPPARRRRQSGSRTGPWLAGALCFLAAVGGITAYAVLKGGGESSGSAADSAAAGSAHASCAPTRAKSATATASVEPAVSGSFLDGAKAASVDVRVSVLDGSGTFGQAQAVISWMQNTERIQHSSNGGPAPAVVPRTTLVYAADHASQARVIAAEMGLPASALHGDGGSSTDGPTGYMVLTLGEDFHGIGKPFAAPVPATPSAPATASAATGAKAGCGSQ